MTEVLRAITVAGGVLVFGALLGLGFGWGFIAGVRAGGGIPHKLSWNNSLNTVVRHQSSEEASVKAEVIH